MFLLLRYDLGFSLNTPVVQLFQEELLFNRGLNVEYFTVGAPDEVQEECKDSRVPSHCCMAVGVQLQCVPPTKHRVKWRIFKLKQELEFYSESLSDSRDAELN